MRGGDNVAAIQADVFKSGGGRFVSLAYSGHNYWEGEREAAIDKFPQPARLQVGDMSQFAGGITMSSGYLALTNAMPGKADIPKLKFNTALEGKSDPYFRCVFDTAEGVGSRLRAAQNTSCPMLSKLPPMDLSRP